MLRASRTCKARENGSHQPHEKALSRARAGARVTARVELAAVGRAHPAPPNAPSEGTRCSRRATASSSERASAITAELCGPRNDRGADRATIYHLVVNPTAPGPLFTTLGSPARVVLIQGPADHATSAWSAKTS